MNDEIRAILADLNLNVYETKEWKEPLGLSQRTWKTLLDYITNLQHENNNLKTSLDESQEVFIELQQENERLEKELKQWKKKYGK